MLMWKRFPNLLLMKDELIVFRHRAYYIFSHLWTFTINSKPAATPRLDRLTFQESSLDRHKHGVLSSDVLSQKRETQRWERNRAKTLTAVLLRFFVARTSIGVLKLYMHCF